MNAPAPVSQVSPTALALVGLRGVALVLSLSGNSKVADGLYALADAAEAGRNVDAHMALVAEKLKARSVTPEDWQEVTAAIEEDSARLHE